MHGSIWPVITPPPPPRDKSSFSGPAVGNCVKRCCARGRGWGESKITSLWFCEVLVIPCTVCMTLKFGEEWLERKNLSNFKSVFEVMFQNFKRMWVWCVLEWLFFLFFCKRRKEIFLQPCLIRRQHKKTVLRRILDFKYVYIDDRDLVQCSYEEGPLGSFLCTFPFLNLLFMFYPHYTLIILL